LLSFARISADKAIATGTALVLCAIALGAAWVSYRFVERPFRHANMAVAPLLWRYAAASVLIALPAFAMKQRQGFPGRFPVASAQEKMQFRTHPCMGGAAPVMSEECLPRADGRPAVALMGDSHGDALAPQMRDLAEASGARLYTLVRGSCPPLVGVVLSTLDRVEKDDCPKYTKAALKLVSADSTVRTVVLAASWAGPAQFSIKGNGYLRDGQSVPVTGEESAANFKQGLESTISALHRAGKRVVILQDDEALRFDAQRRLDAYLIPARRWIHRRVEGEPTLPGSAVNDEMYAKESEAAANAVRQAAAERGAIVFDLRKNLCDGESCKVYSGGVSFYQDSNHLSPAGAALALRGIPLF
jgi:hypothetical protein